MPEKLLDWFFLKWKKIENKAEDDKKGLVEFGENSKAAEWRALQVGVRILGPLSWCFWSPPSPAHEGGCLCPGFLWLWHHMKGSILVKFAEEV